VQLTQGGAITLASIGFSAPLAAPYRAGDRQR
jgi:hypothetical protein